MAIKLLTPLRAMPKWACSQAVHDWVKCEKCVDPDYGRITRVNAMWMKSRCYSCGTSYTWHREHRNQCPVCHWDLGFITALPLGEDHEA